MNMDMENLQIRYVNCIYSGKKVGETYCSYVSFIISFAPVNT